MGDKASYQDYGYFGVLGAEFDENGVATGEYRPKVSYAALQNLASVSEGDWELCDPPLMACAEDSNLTFAQTLRGKELTGGGFARENGAYLYACRMPCDLMTTEYEGVVTLEGSGLPEDFRLIDPMDGSICAVPEKNLERVGGQSFLPHELPVRDYLLLLTLGRNF